MLDHKIMAEFPPATRVMGAIVAFVGLAAVVTGQSIAGLLIAILGLFLSTTRQGIQLNPDQQQYRIYRHFLGLKFGGWQSYANYPYLSILKKNLKSSAASHSTMQTQETSSDQVYDICLLSSNHRQQVVIQRLRAEEEARTQAATLATTLGKEQVAYNPALSSASRVRRDRR